MSYFISCMLFDSFSGTFGELFFDLTFALSCLVFDSTVCRDYRNRASLFDSIEEGGILAPSYSSHEIDEYGNDRAVDGLQDRVNILKRVSHMQNMISLLLHYLNNIIFPKIVVGLVLMELLVLFLTISIFYKSCIYIRISVFLYKFSVQNSKRLCCLELFTLLF